MMGERERDGVCEEESVMKIEKRDKVRERRRCVRGRESDEKGELEQTDEKQIER